MKGSSTIQQVDDFGRDTERTIPAEVIDLLHG